MNINLEDFSINEFRKMVFVYNALINGWNVQKATNSNKFIFKKNRSEIQELDLETDIREFVDGNLNLENLLRNLR